MHRQPPIFIFFWYLGYDITNRKAPDLKIVGLDIPHPEEVYTHLELCIYIYIYIYIKKCFVFHINVSSNSACAKSDRLRLQQ
jgi:hypothetical protein